MHQNIGFTLEPESGQFFGDRRFRRVARYKQGVLIFIGLGVNADPAQGIQFTSTIWRLLS